MLSLLHKYGVVHRIATTYHSQTNGQAEAVKQCNLAYDQAGKQRKFLLQELDKLRLEAYENSRIYKQKVKRFHNQQILRKEFQLIASNLHSRWDGPFVITNIFPYGVVELKDEYTNSTFQIVVNNNSSSSAIINSNQFSTDISLSSSSHFVEPRQMENNDKTLKELVTPDVLKPAQTYELKSGLIHLLPKFHCLAGEDPHKYLKEFHVVCSTMRP
ncbi:hypothetical protein CR513_43468, partial [Mucuna pruriens]